MTTYTTVLRKIEPPQGFLGRLPCAKKRIWCRVGHPVNVSTVRITIDH